MRTTDGAAISLALDRPVEIGGSVSLRLLPQPGFDLENFVVHEDPAFGAEPVLQSSDEVATLRLSSLLRGRLEIARLNLTEPSLNLVRNSAGRWNLEKLFQRADQNSGGPHLQEQKRSASGVPLHRGRAGRINFKFGQEKKPYSLTEADFALWQDSENTWGVRLKAQPMRTDFNLSDTGLLEMNGSWQRSATLHDTPLRITVQWEGAQLGQATKLTLGQDKGWRGAVRLSARLEGTPNNLTVNTDASIEDFRRYDISGDAALRLAAQCDAHYSSADHVFSGLSCRAPVGDGGITLNGSLAAVAGARAYDLTMLARNLPIQSVVDFARRVKKNVPSDIVAAGKLDARVLLRRKAASATGPAFQGGGEVLALSVRSLLTNTRLALDRIPFTVSSGADLGLKQSAEAGPRSARSEPRVRVNDPRIDVGPFNVALGRPTPAAVRGQVSRSGYDFLIQGDTEVQRLLEVARTIGLPAVQPAASGEARISLHVAGSWAGFSPASVTGSATLRTVRARMRGLTQPVEVSSATVDLTPNSAEVSKLNASAAGNTWHGSLSLPRKCDTPRGCAIRFDLHTDEFVSDRLSGQLSGVPGKQPWYRFLSSPSQSRPYLASLYATGKLTASRVLVHNLVASRVSSEVELEQGRLRLSNLHAEMLGGQHSGEWQVDFTANPPAYHGNGSLEKMVLGQVAEAMHDSWITGTANVAYRADTQGWTRAELVSHADASLQVEARDGSLPHLTLAGESDPLRVNQFTGQLLVRDGKLQIEQGKLQTPGGIYQVSGTASPGRVLDFRLARDGAHGFNITGTLHQPRVAISATPDTRAALKP